MTLVAALAVATVAGWFSIVGIMAIFASAPIGAALVMGVVLELAKLMTTSWLYREWQYSSWKLRIPLIYFTIALMLVTSIGVFGFLSKAHLEQGSKTLDNAPRVERIEQQIAKEKTIIADNEKVIAQLDATINSYLGKDRADRSVVIRRNQAPQRRQLRDEIDATNKRIDALSEEKFKLQSEIRALELEVGPIRYIAELFYGTEGNSTKAVEGAVKIFTLLIVSTLDPLAVILLIAANHSILRRQNEKKKKADKEEERRLGDAQQQAVPAVAAPNSSGEVLNEYTPTDEDSAAQSKDASISKEISQEVLDEKAKISSSPTTSTKDIFRDEADTSSIAIIRETLEAKSASAAEGGSATPIQKNIDEVRDTISEKISPFQRGLPPAIVRSPHPSMVLKGNNILQAAELVNEPAEEKIQPPSIEIPRAEITSWAAQDSVLREIIGEKHFIPLKINEEEKFTHAETSDSGAESAQDSTVRSNPKEVSQEGSIEDQIAKRGSEIHKEYTVAMPDHKYPKALSWLTEFKRT